jgi:hypothetical protein
MQCARRNALRSAYKQLQIGRGSNFWWAATM